MGILCFLLHLPTLSPPLLRDLKQSLLQLANLYAISSGGTLRDRIGLCYVQWNRASSSDELKFAYIPRGNFNLRDFHHSVSNLPSDSYTLEPSGFGAANTRDLETTISKLFCKDALYSWGSGDVLRKVVYISSCLVGKIDDAKKILMDAAEQCISVEFVLMEQELDQFVDMCGREEEFSNSISDLENCLLRKYYPVDTWVLSGLVKRWLQEVKDDGNGTHQAVFLFKNDLSGSINEIFCDLSPSTCPIIDGFNPCQGCRCHGLPIGESKGFSSCPVTNHALGCHNLIDNVIRIGEQTILFLPSFQSFSTSLPISSPITFKIMERTSLASVSEGLMVGTSYFVTPSACHEMEAASDEHENSEMNFHLFHGLSRALYYLDQALVCSSNCNTETMKEATFQCFYILQSSDKGQMLLRRLAGSEEILPPPDTIGSMDFQVPNDIEDSIHSSLSKMKLRDYNPLLHERGFHFKLNSLVKESLHFGSIPKAPPAQPSNALTQPVSAFEFLEDDSEVVDTTTDDSSINITKEWEKLVSSEVRGSYSPMCIPKSTVENAVKSPYPKPLDDKTSRILERLEVPKQRKTPGSSPVSAKSQRSEISAPTKKPLVPFNAMSGKDSGTSLSQPMKPVFGKLKRKQR